MSSKYFFIRLSIDKLLCGIEFLSEIFVGHGIIAYEVDTSAEQTFKFAHKIEENISPVESLVFNRIGIEIH